MRRWILALAITLALSTWGLAQTSGGSTGQSDQTTAKSKSKGGGEAGAKKESTVTGCLGGSTGKYTLTNGRYKKGVAVTAGSGVDLAPHVGHEVRLSGTWENSGEGASAAKSFNATGMKHISETCTTGKGEKKGGNGSTSGAGESSKSK